MKIAIESNSFLRSAFDPRPWRRWFVLVWLVLGCFALVPLARAVSPPPDGGYPGFNTAEGDNALLSLTSGTNNTALGANALQANTSGSANTATGNGALATNNSSNNTANGFQALLNNTNGFQNTATGVNALLSNTTGDSNTASGAFALSNNTTGFQNTATGKAALAGNTTGADNTATGDAALGGNTTGSSNTANGTEALFKNTTGSNNTATGYDALVTNNSGYFNTATGSFALYSNTTGSNNTANGLDALVSNTTGKNNIALGSDAGANLTTGNNNIDIGAPGIAREANTIRIGKQGTQRSTFIAGVAGTPVTGSTVVVNSSGKLGVASSSVRFKEAIKPIDKASEAILALKPVSFHYKAEIDPEGIPQFGLIAEEVEKVNPDLVGRDENGKVYTVRYEAVNAMLLNEFLKEHRRVEEQKAGLTEVKSTVAKQQAIIAEQRRQIEALTSSVQKVSEQIERNRPAPQLVANDQ